MLNEVSFLTKLHVEVYLVQTMSYDHFVFYQIARLDVLATTVRKSVIAEIPANHVIASWVCVSQDVQLGGQGLIVKHVSFTWLLGKFYTGQ